MFSNDWFENAKPLWESAIRPWFQKTTPSDILEIGSWEGASTCWLADAAPQATIVCVDTWKGGEEHDPNGMDKVKEAFDQNTFKFGPRITTMQMTSRVALAALASAGTRFDFIYIDGSHHAADVLSDCVLAFQLAKQGCLLVFDDYLWGPWQDPARNHRTPKIAIDAFLYCYRDEVKVLHTGYQVIAQKVADRQ